MQVVGADDFEVKLQHHVGLDLFVADKGRDQPVGDAGVPSRIFCWTHRHRHRPRSEGNFKSVVAIRFLRYICKEILYGLFSSARGSTLERMRSTLERIDQPRRSKE